MTAPDALPPSELPSTPEVRRVMSALVQRYFSRETHARLLDADGSGGAEDGGGLAGRKILARVSEKHPGGTPTAAVRD